MHSHSLPFNHLSYKALYIFLIADLPDNGRSFESLFFWWINAFRNESGMSPFRLGDNSENDSYPQFTFK
jgi:hypothetical protein